MRGKRGFDVLYHHHRGIDQHAQRNRQAAQAHQIGRQAKSTHEHEGAQQRQGQGHRHHQRRTQATQEHIQDDADQHRRFNQCMNHGVGGSADQFAAVVKGVHRHALGQTGRELLELGVHGIHQLAGVDAAHAQHQTFDRFALPVLGHGAVTRQSTELHGCHVVELHLGVVGGVDPNRTHIVQGFDGTFHAHHQGFFARGQSTRAVVAVVGQQGLAHIAHAHAQGSHLGVVGHNLKGLHFTAQ